MSRLSEIRLADFLDEIAAAIRSETPLGEWMSRLRETRLGWITRAAKKFSATLEKGNSASTALLSMHPLFGPQAAAAMDISHQTGDPVLMNRLANQLRLRTQLRRESRIAWVYPILLMWIGFIVIVMPFAPVNLFNQNASLHSPDPFIMPPVAAKTAEMLHQNVFSIGLVCALVTLAIVAWQWLLSPRLSRNARMQLLCGSLADQIEFGVEDQLAIRNAALLADERKLASDPPTTLSAEPMKQLAAQADLPIVDASLQESLVAAYRSLATKYQYRARRSGYVWARVVPRVVTVVVGGGLVLWYALHVIVPIYRGLT